VRHANKGRWPVGKVASLGLKNKIRKRVMGEEDRTKDKKKNLQKRSFKADFGLNSISGGFLACLPCALICALGIAA